MKKGFTTYKNADEFGKAFGLSDLDLQLIRLKKKIIDKLRKTREKKGLSQKKLAELLSSSQPAIARMESGLVSEVSLDFLCRAALILEVTLTIKSDAA